MSNASLVDAIVSRVLSELGSANEPGAQVGPGQPIDLAALIDHTLLAPDALPEDIDRLCDEAVQHRFASVCVQPCYAARAAARLAPYGVPVASVVGFPHGATTTATKRFEAEKLLAVGARELDMVMAIGACRSEQWTVVADDVRSVVQAAERSGSGALVKVIIEACMLIDAEKVAACVIAEECGADFVKTSTGYGGGGATVEDVALVRRVVGDRLGVKAAGGIRTRAQAVAMAAAGASRLGTSAGPAIVSEPPQ